MSRSRKKANKSGYKAEVQSIVEAYEEREYGRAKSTANREKMREYFKEDDEVQRYIIAFKRYIRTTKDLPAKGLGVGYGLAFTVHNPTEKEIPLIIQRKMMRENFDTNVWGIVAAWIVDSEQEKPICRQVYGHFNEDDIPINMALQAAASRKKKIRDKKPHFQFRNDRFVPIERKNDIVVVPAKPPTKIVQQPFTVIKVKKDQVNQEVT